MFKYPVNRIGETIRKQGACFFISRIFQAILAFPFATLIILISPIYKIRFICLYTSRIGEYTLNTYLMFRALESKKFVEEIKCRHFYYAQPSSPIANVFFHQMWSRTIPVLSYSVLVSFIDRILVFFLKEKYNTPFKVMYEKSGGGIYRWEHLSKFKTQYISFTKKELKIGEMLKSQFGLSQNSRFVCLLVRDSRYLQVHMPDTDDWKYHAYRNADIKNYMRAVEFLVQNGFYVIRMGKHVDPGATLKINNSKYIDYANSNLRSDFLDVYFSAHCDFFISNGSGIDAIAQIFNRPLFVVSYNLFDIRSSLYFSYMIPKNVKSIKEDRLITYLEIFNDYTHFFLSGKCISRDPRRVLLSEWERKGWVIIENTPDEILSGVKDMVNSLDKGYIEKDEEKKLNEFFWKKFPCPVALEEEYWKNARMRISPSFLRKHVNLLN